MSKLNNNHKLIIWLSYNTGRNTILLSNAISLELKYSKATKGTHKFCKCKDSRGKAVNEYWIEWHCINCLKLKADNV